MIEMNENTNRRMEALERKIEQTGKPKKWSYLYVLLNAVTISINHEVPNKKGQTSRLSWTALILTWFFTLKIFRFGWALFGDCFLRILFLFWALLKVLWTLCFLGRGKVLRWWIFLLIRWTIHVLNRFYLAFIGVWLLHLLLAVRKPFR